MLAAVSSVAMFFFLLVQRVLFMYFIIQIASRMVCIIYTRYADENSLCYSCSTPVRTLRLVLLFAIAPVPDVFFLFVGYGTTRSARRFLLNRAP